ncbi:MAG: protein kinase [Sandaracinaceae bacterium]|nr:protein kinase [Sandaracinaceae bacterium]
MAEAFLGVRDGPGGFEQRVCVKRVLPAYGGDAEFVRLFLREARLAASLSHRNVTGVVDFGQDGDSYFLALELVEGADLRRILKARPAPQRLPAAATVLVGIEIAAALEHAHTRGGSTGPVVHRDVSPANILVSVDGDVKLTDFGISKALGDARASRSEFVRGNIWYMAPEQLEQPGIADPRSDLFSLGVVLYQCLSGRRPYAGGDDLSAMMALSRGVRAPLLELAPDAPPRLAAMIDKLICQRPDGRFGSAAELGDALATEANLIAARRELRTLVVDSLRRPPKARALVAVREVEERTEPVLGAPILEVGPTDPQSKLTETHDPPGELGPARSGGDALTSIERRKPPKIESRARRWQPYSVAPGVWSTPEPRGQPATRPPATAPPANGPPPTRPPARLTTAKRGKRARWAIGLAVASVLLLALALLWIGRVIR